MKVGDHAPDGDFARIARSLRVWELMSETQPEDFTLSAEDFDLRPGDTRGRTGEHFLNFYSEEGLRIGLKAYGLHDHLVSIGLADYELVVSREDAFHHRLEAFIGGERDDDHRIMDLRIHLRRIAAPGHEDEEGARPTFDVMVVEWLSMQNPRAQFAPDKPQLPGQRFPGTGLGRAMHNILIIMAERTRREGLLNVPHRFYLARLYQRLGYRFPTLDTVDELDAVQEALAGLSFTAGAWAVERGCVKVCEGGEEKVWRFEPKEMLMPLSSRLEDQLPGFFARVRHRFVREPQRRFFVDTDKLKQSLLDDPVVGVDPDGIRKGR